MTIGDLSMSARGSHSPALLIIRNSILLCGNPTNMMYCLSDHFQWMSHMMVQFPIGAGKVYAYGSNAHLIYNIGRNQTKTHIFPMRPELAREMGPLGAIDVRVDEADNRLAISFFAITLRREVAIHI